MANFTDDFMFGKVLYNHPELCRELLELILDKKIRKIQFPEVQKSISVTGDGKGVRFDIYTEDSENIVYDVEMQTTSDENLPKRSRYYHSMLDLSLIEKGRDYKELKKCYVIFICKRNIGRFPIYSYRMRCDAAPEIELGDDTRTIFVNAYGSSKGISKKLREFLAYIKTGEPSNDPKSLTRKLQSCVIQARKHKEWRTEYMTLLMKYQEMMEEGRKEGLKEGRKEGLKEGRKEGLKEGRKEGLKEGRKEGLEEGHIEINQLVAALIADNRMDELKRSAVDKMFQEQLLKEYQIGRYESA